MVFRVFREELQHSLHEGVEDLRATLQHFFFDFEKESTSTPIFLFFFLFFFSFFNDALPRESDVFI